MNRTLAVFLLLALLGNLPTYGQQGNELSLERSFGIYAYNAPQPRKMMQLKKLKRWQKWNPLVYVSAGAMFFYQRAISPQMSTSCRFQESCSAYAKRMVEERGLGEGVLLGSWRWQACNGNVNADYSPFMVDTESGRIQTFRP